MKHMLATVCCGLLMLLVACTSSPTLNTTPTPTFTAIPSPTPTQAPKGVPWSSVNDFLYQLQDIDLAAIGDTEFDLVIMDYSADGSDTGRFTAEEIGALRNSSGGPKLVLAYMSIGEVED